MLRAWCLSFSALLLPIGSALADDPSGLAANAALKYWQAFATMPKFTEAEQNSLMAEYLTMPLDARAKEIVSKADYSLRMMHQGAALPRSEWAIGIEEEGINAMLPQMTAARVLTSIACLRARMRFEEGKSAAAIDDIMAAFATGRHVSTDGSLLGVLVRHSIEIRTSTALAIYLPTLDPKAVKELQPRLRTLPKGGTIAEALMNFEAKTMVWFINQVKASKDQSELLARLAFVGDNEKARKFLEECGGADGLIKFATELAPSYERMAKSAALPLPEVEKAFQLEAERQSKNPVFKLLFPALLKVRTAQVRADVRSALLSAAIAHVLDPRDGLSKYPDPIVGGAFEVVPFKGGFELRSRWREDDKPLSLTVGQREK